MWTPPRRSPGPRWNCLEWILTELSPPSPEHATDRLEILPVEGLPEFRPGDDLTGAIAGTAHWLRSGDVVVVTSKIVSKTEGRLVRVPADPEAREEARRKLVEEEAVRVIARIGRTMITQNRIGV